jgi:hypothetical protein
MKTKTKAKAGGTTMPYKQTGITVRSEAAAKGGHTRRCLRAVLGLAAALSLNARAEQTNAPQATQQTQTVRVVNTNAEAVPVGTSPAVAPHWSAVRNGTFNNNMIGLTVSYPHSSGKRAIVRYISVDCQFSVATQAYVTVDGYLGPLVFPLTSVPHPAIPAVNAVGGKPVELVLDAGGFANFAISRSTASGTGVL